MKNTSIKRIVFVWNEDFSLSGGIRALRDVARQKHSCSLCEIAYHRITQTNEWKSYKKSLGIQIKEPCKNQLTSDEKIAANNDFPTVLAHTNGGVIKLMSSQQIDSCGGQFETFKAEFEAALEKTNT